MNYLGATLTWKNGRQLASYSKGDLSVSYKYNADGLRTQKKVVENGKTTVYNYVWNGNRLVYQSWIDSNQEKFIYFIYDKNENIIGFSYADGNNYANYYYLKNEQGDVIGIVDATGNTLATYTYDVWGAFGGGSGQINISPIRYRGYYFDSEELSFGGFTKKIGIFY